MLLFTSGSTGTPKGVILGGGQHRRERSADRLRPRARARRSDGGARIARLRGVAHAHLRRAHQRRSVNLYDLRERGPRRHRRVGEPAGITVMLFVPSVLRAVLDFAPDVRMDTVRLVTFGGEALYGRDVRSARTLFRSGTVFRNRLSSTETHGIAGRFVTADDDDLDGVVPVGDIEPWLDARIVDDDNEDVPDGHVGRLVVDRARPRARVLERPGAHRGPLRRTARRPSHASSPVIWCAAAPMARSSTSAEPDDRLKVRGAMVSPIEVERALCQLEDVSVAAVMGVPADDGGQRLVAYVVPDATRHRAHRRSGASSPPWFRRTWCPVPSCSSMRCRSISRGKVDRAALPGARRDTSGLPCTRRARAGPGQHLR